MKITGSTNFVAVKPGESYSNLVDYHFEKDRVDLGVSKSEELSALNFSGVFNNVNPDDFDHEVDEMIREYNAKPSQKKNKKRQFKNKREFLERKLDRKNINKDFHGLEFMMMVKLGDMRTWQGVVEEFEEHGVSEADTLEVLNDAFIKVAEHFQNKYEPSNLKIATIYTNLDEHGAPHFHARVLNKNRDQRSGLPDLGLGSALRKMPGNENKTNREVMKDLREDLDTLVVDLSNKRLHNLANSRGFEFSGLEFVRLESDVTGLSHEEYIGRVEAQVRELKDREEALNARERALDEREKQINARGGATSQNVGESRTEPQAGQFATPDVHTGAHQDPQDPIGNVDPQDTIRKEWEKRKRRFRRTQGLESNPRESRKNLDNYFDQR